VGQEIIRRNAGWGWPKRIWAKVHEPRAVAIIQALIYLALGLGGVTALLNSPNTIEGAIGENSMTTLAFILAVSCTLGIPAALFGIQWLEQIIVWGVFSSGVIYALIIIGLHYGSTGNRLLQLSFVVAVTLYQVMRFIRVHGAPYDKNLTPGDTAAPAI
jgi:hypothetical protein